MGKPSVCIFFFQVYEVALVFAFSGPGIGINSISFSSTFCATGSEDGYLRLWPLDFSAVVLEAGEQSWDGCFRAPQLHQPAAVKPKVRCHGS